ncbi:MAG: precorrin-2 C(20)-methyltransferase [Lachnospiraceae bacterium]|nr:precorrin-2 C(20)-methyltransferase [Lachnospiraceae bacterium]
MSGILYGVGVGPGDPELMTLKAVRMIKENNIIAFPGERPKETTAYRIAVAAVPELADKQLIPVHMPMTRDKEIQGKCHRENAEMLEILLKEGNNIIFLTLGDPTIYSTFTYIQQIMEEDGFQTQLISGVPSFCAAAARVNMPLAVRNEQIHIVPAVDNLIEFLPDSGTCVFMKTGSKMKQLKEIIRKSGRYAVMIENCGMEEEQVCFHVDDMPDTTGYYSLIIAKETE